MAASNSAFDAALAGATSALMRDRDSKVSADANLNLVAVAIATAVDGANAYGVIAAKYQQLLKGIVNGYYSGRRPNSTASATYNTDAARIAVIYTVLAASVL